MFTDTCGRTEFGQSIADDGSLRYLSGQRRHVHNRRRNRSTIRLETYKSQDRTAMDVPRRQSVKL